MFRHSARLRLAHIHLPAYLQKNAIYSPFSSSVAASRSPSSRLFQSASIPSPLRGARRNNKAFLAVAGAGIAGLSLLYGFSSERVADLTVVPPPHGNPSDPLFALSPRALLASTAHLEQLSTSDLLKVYVVYLASSQPLLIEAAPWILKKLEWSRDNIPLVGRLGWAIFTTVMRSTFYDVFVGGETVEECQPKIQAFQERGIGCLLSYAAEASVDGSALSTGVNPEHLMEARKAALAAAQLSTTPSTTSAPSMQPTSLAIKVTGLVFDPALLARASSALLNSSAYLRGTDLASSILFPEAPELSDEDHVELGKLYEGLRAVCDAARAGGVRLMLDAEQSWFQPSINRFAELLSEEFNVPSKETHGPAIPIVHNTYQCYLRSTPDEIANSLAKADAKGYSWGAKLVRGAYVESERKRWRSSGSEGDCVVWGSKEETDKCYDDCALLLETRVVNEVVGGKDGSPGTSAFLASHNSTSFRKVLEALRDHGLAKETENGLEVDERVRGRLSFAQLMGMSDNLTSALLGILENSESTPRPNQIPLISKWVPYASVDDAMPYLIRRANENRSIMDADPTSGRAGALGERRAAGRELRRRMGLSF